MVCIYLRNPRRDKSREISVLVNLLRHTSSSVVASPQRTIPRRGARPTALVNLNRKSRSREAERPPEFVPAKPALEQNMETTYASGWPLSLVSQVARLAFGCSSPYNPRASRWLDNLARE